MAQPMYWTVLDFTGVPNKVAIVCNLSVKSYLQSKTNVAEKKCNISCRDVVKYKCKAR